MSCPLRRILRHHDGTRQGLASLRAIAAPYRRPMTYRALAQSNVAAKTSVIARILYGAGYAVVPSFPLDKPRGWSADWRYLSFVYRVLFWRTRAPLGAPSRRLFRPGAALSAGAQAPTVSELLAPGSSCPGGPTPPECVGYVCP